MSTTPSKLGLVLSAGGSRAAYQVGVLRYLAEHCRDFQPKIFTGVSAGSINASFLSQGEDIRFSCRRLYELWEQLEFSQVLQGNFKSILSMASRIVYDLFLSKVTHRVLFKSILDASPLAQTLLSHIHFWKISKAIRAAVVEGLAISTTNYHDGTTTIFYDSTDLIPPWHRDKRVAIRTSIRIRHIMASCSIPILFEPVKIGKLFYGDGALRLKFPLSPAIHLGARRIIAIGIRAQTSETGNFELPSHLSIGFIAGSVLNSIFLDSLEADYETLCRMNEATGEASPINKIEIQMIRPSRDLGSIARDFIDEVPFHLRQLLKTSSANAAELADLLSYLMFSKSYLKALLELGYKDAETQHVEIEKFLGLKAA